MNNKTLGTEWENEVCELMASRGYWVHFIVPDARGAQPFDVIAVKDGKGLAIDCKTCVSSVFNISRLEDNQIMAFELWMKRGNDVPMIAVKHNHKLYWISYVDLKKTGSVKLSDCECDKEYMEG